MKAKGFQMLNKQENENFF